MIQFVQQAAAACPRQLTHLAETVTLVEKRAIEIIQLDAQTGGDVARWFQVQLPSGAPSFYLYRRVCSILRNSREVSANGLPVALFLDENIGEAVLLTDVFAIVFDFFAYQTIGNRTITEKPDC